ncbi:hypothetical protein CRUP_009502 [Coryphaenoides rupestris]|nr:hypothetical protein CRUP_009502 [Coryphaenoides rupestris]
MHRSGLKKKHNQQDEPRRSQRRSFLGATGTTTWCTVSGTESSPFRSTQNCQLFFGSHASNYQQIPAVIKIQG